MNRSKKAPRRVKGERNREHDAIPEQAIGETREMNVEDRAKDNEENQRKERARIHDDEAHHRLEISLLTSAVLFLWAVNTWLHSTAPSVSAVVVELAGFLVIYALSAVAVYYLLFDDARARHFGPLVGVCLQFRYSLAVAGLAVKFLLAGVPGPDEAFDDLARLLLAVAFAASGFADGLSARAVFARTDSMKKARP